MLDQAKVSDDRTKVSPKAKEDTSTKTPTTKVDEDTSTKTPATKVDEDESTEGALFAYLAVLKMSSSVKTSRNAVKLIDPYSGFHTG